MSQENQWDIHLPEELVRNLKYEGFDKNVVQLSVAVFLFIGKKVSLERAAFLAGIPLVDFMNVLKANGISWAEYTEEHLEQDLKYIDKRFGTREEGK